MLQIDNISHGYGELKVLDNVSFSVHDNEIVALMGPSGCGKSSILNMAAGIITPKEGSINLNGQRLSFIFQDDRLLPWKNVWDNISIVGDGATKSGDNPKNSDDRIRQLIDDVGLTGFEKYRPDELSGGMRKRCGIARAFYYNADFLLMDEPFSGLDFCLRQEMLKMVMRVWEKQKPGILFVTHEIDEALAVAGRIVLLSKRPAAVINEIELPPYNERADREEDMLRIRKEILETIVA